MSREYNESCCWTIEKFSFFHNYFAIIDTADYLADQLFIKHQVRVGFGPEFVCPDAPYRVIMCKCRKRDVDAFLAAIRELPNKMLLCGHPDYLTFCEDSLQIPPINYGCLVFHLTAISYFDIRFIWSLVKRQFNERRKQRCLRLWISQDV